MRHLFRFALAVLCAACSDERGPSEAAPPIVALDAPGHASFQGKAIDHAAIATELATITSGHGQFGIAAEPKLLGLRINRAVPWVEVQWTLAAIAQCNIKRVRVTTGPHEFEVSVWPRALLCLYPECPEKDSLVLQVAIGQDGTYRCGERKTRNVGGLDRWVEEARERVRREDLRSVAAVLFPRKKAPWGSVADAFALLRAAGVAVEFYGYTESRDMNLDESFGERYRTGGTWVVPRPESAFDITPEYPGDHDDTEDAEELEDEENRKEPIVPEPVPEVPDRD